LAREVLKNRGTIKQDEEFKSKPEDFESEEIEKPPERDREPRRDSYKRKFNR
jgi:hypothetical protein